MTIVPTANLAKLARTANREHILVQDLAAKTLNHAILGGEALLAAREAVPWGDWLTWLSENFDGTAQTARLYMRLAKHRHELEHRHIATLNGAESYLRNTATTFHEQRSEARQMRKEGMSVIHIAGHFGVSAVTVYNWLNPSYRDKKAQRSRERRIAAAALRQQERDKAMRTVGGEASAAYTLLRKLATRLDTAWRDETGKDARRAFGEALNHLYHVEDELVAAVRLSHPELRSVLASKRGD